MLVPYDAKTLGKITSTDTDTVRVAMDIFTKIGLIQILENGEIFLSQLQNMVGSETKWAENKRLQRQKKSEDNVLLLSGQCPIEIDIEKDIENRDKIIEIEKVSNYIGTEENLKQFIRLYEQNIGLINGISGEWLKEMSETIDYRLFKRAIEISTDKGKCNLGYIKGIIKQWLDVNITTLEQLEAYKLQQEKSKKDVKSDVGRRERTIKTESTADNRESEEARRSELLRQIKELDEL